MPDVEQYMSQYERGLQPYYQMAGQRYKQAIQRQLGQSQRQMGEQFQQRGLYGTGMYGRGLTGLHQGAMQEMGQGLGGLEMQRLGQVGSRREALQNMLYGSEESEKQRQWQGYQDELRRMQEWKMFRQQMMEQGRQRSQQSWQGPLSALFGGVGAVAGSYYGAKAAGR